MIERYIANGKLIRLLAKQENQASAPSVRQVPRNQNSSGHEARSGGQLYGRERKPAQPPRIDMRAEKEVQREQSRSWGRLDNTVDFPDIQTIVGGFGRGGETCTARKSYAKEMRGESSSDLYSPLGRKL